MPLALILSMPSLSRTCTFWVGGSPDCVLFQLRTLGGLLSSWSPRLLVQTTWHTSACVQLLVGRTGLPLCCCLCWQSLLRQCPICGGCKALVAVADPVGLRWGPRHASCPRASDCRSGQEGKNSLHLTLNFKAAGLGEVNPILHNEDM